MKKCSYCGAQNEDDNLFCTECGKELPKGFVCSICGTYLDAGDMFCSNCGKKIDIVQTVQQVAQDESTPQQTYNNDSSNGSNKSLLYVLIGLVLVVIIGGAWFLMHSDKTTASAQDNLVVEESVSSETLNESNSKEVVGYSDSSEKTGNSNLNDSSRSSIEMSLSGKVGGEAILEMQKGKGWYQMTYKGSDKTQRTIELESYNPVDGQCVLNAYLRGKYIGKFSGKVQINNDSKTVQTYKGIFESVKGAKLDFYFHSN